MDWQGDDDNCSNRWTWFSDLSSDSKDVQVDYSERRFFNMGGCVTGREGQPPYYLMVGNRIATERRHYDKLTRRLAGAISLKPFLSLIKGTMYKLNWWVQQDSKHH
jgi:hypothetical protein